MMAIQSGSSLAPETLQRARCGDRDAQAEIYECCAPMVFTLARRMLASTALAEDVTQDTFVEVIRGVAGLRDQSLAEAWIRRIAVNKCLSMLRSSWWQRRGDLPDDEILADMHNRHSAETEIDVGRLMDHLPATARAVVWLHDAEGFTHKEIAGLMGRTVSFSKSQLKRAHDRLRAEFDETETEDVSALCTNAMKTI